MPEVTVSILTYSQVGFARRCIESILNGGEEVAFILTANGNEEAANYFRDVASRVPNVTVVVNPTNQGFWKPNNHALTLCETPFFCMVNDDVAVPRGWLTLLKKPFRDFPNDSAFSGPDDGCSELTSSFHGKFGRREYIEGSCMLACTAVVKKHGLFDEMPGLAYAEDSNASLKFRELGYRLHWVPLRINHARAQTSRHVPEVRIWQELNHAYCRNRWANYLKFRSFDYPIIVRRTGAYGDVLLTTPIIRALKLAHPKNPIYVETVCTSIFDRNPHVTQVGPRFNLPNPRYIVLDGAYEAQPRENFLDSFAKVASVTLESRKTELYLSEQDIKHATSLIPEGNWIAIHTGPTWASKMWAPGKWAALSNKLMDLGFKVVNLGTGASHAIPCTLDLRAKTTHHQLAAVIKRCILFVGIDSFPIHAAQAVGTPVLGLFGVTLPGPILTDGSRAEAIVSDPNHPSSGARHRAAGTTFTAAEHNPMDTITEAAVFEKALTMLPVL